MKEMNEPTPSEMGLPEEFVYAVKIVEMAKKVDLSKQCDCDELIRVIEKSLTEYKNKIKNEN